MGASTEEDEEPFDDTDRDLSTEDGENGETGEEGLGFFISKMDLYVKGIASSTRRTGRTGRQP